MLMDVYFERQKEVQKQIEITQRDAIIAAGNAIAERLSKGGAWHVLDTGHMLMHEAIGRTGGMIAIKPVRIHCEVENPVRHRDLPYRGATGYDSIPGFADFVLGRATIVEGDVLVVGSVSGYNYFPVDLALKAREKGVLTVAFTAVAYSSRLTSKHPSGKRLFEACEHVLDNCSNYGDTLVPVEQLGQAICPSSGIGAAYLMWALQCAVVERLLAMGKNPGVYISNHMPGASEHNADIISQYNKIGY